MKCFNKFCPLYHGGESGGCTRKTFAEVEKCDKREIYLTANKDAVATVPYSDGLCGCGNKSRYQTKSGMACNKHYRCPTYKELTDEAWRLKMALLKIKRAIDETPI